MNLVNIQFLDQPTAGQIIGFDLAWDNGTSGTISIEFDVDVTIGATLSDTIENTENYITNYLLINGLQRVTQTIEGANLILTPFIIGFTASNFVSVVEVVIVSDSSVNPFFTKINVRSPYFLQVDEAGQDGSKIELFIWNKGTTKPTIPQHILSKSKVSDFQTSNEYNISDFAKEYINPIAPTEIPLFAEENVDTWCYLEVKRFKLVAGTYTQIDTVNFICLNGFNSFLDGVNHSSISRQIPLTNVDIKRLQQEDGSHYVNVWLEAGDYQYVNDFGVNNFTVEVEGIWKLALKNNFMLLKVLDGDNILLINTTNECEPIYTPLKCAFINRYGGWDFITLFKNSINNFNATSKDFNLLPSALDYDTRQGRKQDFNFELMQKLKCNTGFVPENYSELIKDLIVSEVVLLDNKPVKVLTTSYEEKTTFNNNNINYEIEFEYNYNLINDVI